ncbi:MAG: hypothetical protein KJZ80_19475 [Hyphomicrobiaceae bacterium]|nr:hypothetical protein [Hyphomicrobiaceae bacterium]
MVRPRGISLTALLTAVLAGACSEGVKLPALPALPGTSEPLRAQGPVVDVYMRIARGAMACWFGADGALSGSHIFHADVEPASRGGTAEVVVHEMDHAQPKPWGRRAFRVLLGPADGATAISVENLAMPDEVATRMRADVFQWIESKAACSTKQSPAIPAARGGSGPAPQRPGPPPGAPAASPSRPR